MSTTMIEEMQRQFQSCAVKNIGQCQETGDGSAGMWYLANVGVHMAAIAGLFVLGMILQ